MADPSRTPEDEDPLPPGSDHGLPSGTPRWPLIVAIVLAIALLGLIVFLHLSGAIGPGVH
ncbi:MAG TPA: hypothetical protein VE669_02670 [Actinomycetota bacterium]|nr:hypothetical protein [Actinomycetota bacterium]